MPTTSIWGNAFTQNPITHVWEPIAVEPPSPPMFTIEEIEAIIGANKPLKRKLEMHPSCKPHPFFTRQD